jgi:hypothetical protein
MPFIKHCCCGVTTCEGIRECLLATEDGFGGYLMGVDLVLTISGVGDTANCDKCDSFNGAWPGCTDGVILDYPGNCSIGNRFYYIHVGGEEFCGFGFQIFLDGISLDGIQFSLVASTHVGSFHLTTAEDPTWLERFCAGEEITLHIREDEFGDYDYLDVFDCDFSGATVKIKLVPAGSVSCQPILSPDADCLGIADCDPIPGAHLGLYSFSDYDEAFVSHFVFTSESGTAHWLLSNLNMGFSMPYDSGSYVFDIELYTAGTYYGGANTDGVLIRQDEFDPSASDPLACEVYVYRITLTVDCTDGVVTITHITLYYDVFIGSDVNTWPTSNGQFSADFESPTHITTTHEGLSYPCVSSETTCDVEYDQNILFPLAGSDFSFKAVMGIGSAV